MRLFRLGCCGEMSFVELASGSGSTFAPMMEEEAGLWCRPTGHMHASPIRSSVGS